MSSSQASGAVGTDSNRQRIGRGDVTAIPCVLMRGGTSRGPYLRGEDLPQEPAARDRLLAGIMGSGHDLQVDGIGGGHPMTSKIAIVSRSARPGVDVEYLFAQAGVAEAVIDTSPNCGNMLSGVGPFAIEAGMVAGHRPRDPGPHPQRQHRQADRGHRPDAGRPGDLRGHGRHRRRARHGGPDPAQLPRCRRLQDRPPPAHRIGTGRDPGRGSELHRHGDADGHHARRRPRQDRPRGAGRARPRPRLLRAAGVDPARGR